MIMNYRGLFLPCNVREFIPETGDREVTMELQSVVDWGMWHRLEFVI